MDIIGHAAAGYEFQCLTCPDHAVTAAMHSMISSTGLTYVRHGVFFVITGSVARSAKHRYLSYSEADFEVLLPAGATRCTDGVKFCMEVRTKGPLLCAKFHPHRCNDKGRPIGPPKLKFLLRFDQNVEYKRPSGAYPLRDFHKICSLYHVSGALSVKISLDFLKGLCIVMGVLS